MTTPRVLSVNTIHGLVLAQALNTMCVRQMRKEQNLCTFLYVLSLQFSKQTLHVITFSFHIQVGMAQTQVEGC